MCVCELVKERERDMETVCLKEILCEREKKSVCWDVFRIKCVCMCACACVNASLSVFGECVSKGKKMSVLEEERLNFSRKKIHSKYFKTLQKNRPTPQGIDFSFSIFSFSVFFLIRIKKLEC